MEKNIIRDIFKICFAGILFTLTACKELTQPLLTDKQVNIIAPVDNLVTNAATNTFTWEDLDGAAKYQLQIVSPRFDSVVNFVVDSTFTNHLFTYTLTPGVYQWRVRAINAGSQTNYFIRSITIQ